MGHLPNWVSASRLKIGTIVVISLIHAAALAAPFTFTWTGFFVCLVMIWVTGGLGITLCYHRLLTHRSYWTYKPIEYLLTCFGCFALQGGPITWVATHRLHHKESDEEEDPHTPQHTFWWSHILWNFYRDPQLDGYEKIRRFAKDLDKDRVLRFFEKYFFPIYVLFAVVLYGIGHLIGGWQLGLSLVVWGVAVRTVLVWHFTWLVNSATHQWGYTNYKTTDNSRNTWWVALLTFGEGWHNNHHADQRSAAHGHRWWEIDQTYITIKIMQWLGLAKDVVTPGRLSQIRSKDVPGVELLEEKDAIPEG
ncbi:MAG TPA: fatty acid desaturase [Candidatus Hydrogenedentes bacterium]|nr:fatty acid desaturase [Candidatus Hydrogenedentota bacterium]